MKIKLKGRKVKTINLKRIDKMKETTIINRISNLVENMNYKSVYIEIKTDNNKWILEKEKQTRIKGFSNEH